MIKGYFTIKVIIVRLRVRKKAPTFYFRRAVSLATFLKPLSLLGQTELKRGRLCGEEMAGEGGAHRGPAPREAAESLTAGEVAASLWARFTQRGPAGLRRALQAQWVWAGSQAPPWVLAHPSPSASRGHCSSCARVPRAVDGASVTGTA